ncbi:DUF6691 family protein [Roseovarius aestuariivivens]|uniref:DUF6691 family protein n=1 Tax=Roseovarius aestuariivivens TaxID=1888910 RepID=UPI001080D987|nr:DUF6691 family protein [Roseovarius aestuariivivens]
MRALFAFLAGGLFGVGLMLSGMTDTAKVQGWLDVLGAWDPTLAFVLGGAILPMLVAWRVAGKRPTAALGTPIPAKPAQIIDARLLAGATLFGIGWALVGLCPGPALAALSYNGGHGAVFVVAMVAGMLIWHILHLGGAMRGRPA